MRSRENSVPIGRKESKNRMHKERRKAGERRPSWGEAKSAAVSRTCKKVERQPRGEKLPEKINRP